MGLPLVFVIVGALLGLVIGASDSTFLGIFAGAAIGLAFAKTKKLSSEMETLRRRVDRTERVSSAVVVPPRSENLANQNLGTDTTDVEPQGLEAATISVAASRTAPARSSASLSDPADPEQAAPPISKPTATNQKPDIFETLGLFAKRWLTTGNVPVKVGVIICFFGIAFLLKYAVDNQLFSLPVEFRLLAIAAVGVGLCVFGWRLRERTEIYALSLQGGGVGILYLTIFASMALYGLVPAGLAFFLLVVLTAFAGCLAVVQDSRVLAMLGIVGGFLAPVLVSTGSGNHVMLFSYFLLLNAAILGIAWFRAWRKLNLMGFAFTFIIGGLWGYANYEPELFNSTEPFLILFFLFFQLIAILWAHRQPTELKNPIDGTLVFGTPVIAFGLQARLVSEFEYGLAISAIVLALFYLISASLLHRSQGKRLQTLVEAFLALGIAFGTLAIPLALDARWTAAAWSLEGAALAWIGGKQQSRLSVAAGIALIFGASISFALYGWEDSSNRPMLFNGNLLGAWLIAAAALFAAWCLNNFYSANRSFKPVAVILIIWAFMWWLGGGLREIDGQVADKFSAAAQLGLLAITAAAVLSLSRKLHWRALRAATLFFLPLFIIPSVSTLIQGSAPLANFGWLLWPLAFGLQYRILWSREAEYPQPVATQHTLSLLALTGILAWEVGHRVGETQLSSSWQVSGMVLVPLLFIAGVLLMRERLTWPIDRHWRAYAVHGCGLLVSGALLSLAIAGVDTPADPAPLAYLPILNPFDLVTLAALLMAVLWLKTLRETKPDLTTEQWQLGLIMLGIVAFVTTTSGVLRAAHHLGGVDWHPDALFSSVYVQAALSVYWGLLGFIGMVWGARHERRILWMIGAGLMAIVVLKLFIVDLGNTGTIARIVSFIGTGGLLLVVGYFAPAPPRREADTTPAASTES